MELTINVVFNPRVLCTEAGLDRREPGFPTTTLSGMRSTPPCSHAQFRDTIIVVERQNVTGHKSLGRDQLEYCSLARERQEHAHQLVR